MKTIIAYIFLFATINLAVSCTTLVVTSNPSSKEPPGQQKKRTGSKSAKPYAPGQQKKK